MILVPNHLQQSSGSKTGIRIAQNCRIKKEKMRYLLLLIVFIPLFNWAQPRVVSKVEVDGKKYYQHIAEAGNTLWGLQRMYGVKVEDIVARNPELKNGLRTGQVVLIPVTENSIRKIPTEEYKVRKKETLYGLSQKFNVSIDDLIVLNPELKDGLKKGQIIKVPKGESPFSQETTEDSSNPFVTENQSDQGTVEQVKFVFEDSIVNHKVLAHETMYAVSKRFMAPISEIMKLNNLSSTALREGQILKIPIKKERIEKVEIKPVPEDVQVEVIDSYDPFGSGEVEFEPKERYKVAIMLPFMVGMSGSRSQAISEVATHFYMGTKLALDSLNELGLNADVKILDTKNDSTTIANLLQSEEMQNVDVIVGPLLKKHFKQVTEFGRENKIRVVIPSESVLEDIDSNRMVYQTITSKEGFSYNLGKYLADNNSTHKIILVKSSQDSLYREAFKSGLYAGNSEGIDLNLIETTSSNVTGNLSRGVKTHIVFASQDPQKAKEFFTLLNRGAHRISSKDLSVYGSKKWLKTTVVSDQMKNKFKWRFASSNFLDYYSDQMIEMNSLFRKRFKTDFSKMAVHGYDVTSFFLAGFCGLEKHPNLLMSRFDLKQKDDFSGYRNCGTFIVENEDFELFNAELPRE